MGRPVNIRHVIDALPEGSPLAKDRLVAILESLTNQIQVQHAAATLDHSPQYFHGLRTQVLTAALHAAEPRPLGRPSKAEDEHLVQVRKENERLKTELRDLMIRKEIGDLRCQMVAANMTGKLKGIKKKRH